MNTSRTILAAMLMFCSAPSTRGAESPYLGSWTNEDPLTRGVTRVTIAARNGKFVLHAWGSCVPQECDWGDAEGSLQDGRILVKWNPWFVVTQWQVVLETPLRLRISEHNHFIDTSGRLDSNHTYFFGRSSESSERTAGVPTPMPLSPQSGAKFDHYPRKTNLEWGAVPGAAAYTVEIDCFHCCQTNGWCADVSKAWRIVPNVRYPSFQFDFVGMQRGRWRVCAVDPLGRAGAWSVWSEFLYLR